VKWGLQTTNESRPMALVAIWSLWVRKGRDLEVPLLWVLSPK